MELYIKGRLLTICFRVFLYFLAIVCCITWMVNCKRFVFTCTWTQFTYKHNVHFWFNFQAKYALLRWVNFTHTGIAELTRLLANLGVSIKDMVHERAWIRSDIFSVEVRIKVLCAYCDFRYSALQKGVVEHNSWLNVTCSFSVKKSLLSGSTNCRTCINFLPCIEMYCSTVGIKLPHISHILRSRPGYTRLDRWAMFLTCQGDRAHANQSMSRSGGVGISVACDGVWQVKVLCETRDKEHSEELRNALLQRYQILRFGSQSPPGAMGQ